MLYNLDDNIDILNNNKSIQDILGELGIETIESEVYNNVKLYY